MLIHIEDCILVDDNKYTSKGKAKRNIELKTKSGERKSSTFRIACKADAPGLDEIPFQQPIPRLILDVDVVNYRKEGQEGQFLLVNGAMIPKDGK